MSCTHPSPGDATPSGIGGWLLLVIFGLIALSPYLESARWQVGTLLAESVLPYPSNAPAWQSYKIQAWLVVMLSAGLGIYAGDRLIFVHSWRTIQGAMIVIWTKFFLITVVLDSVLPGTIVLADYPPLDPVHVRLLLLIYGAVTAYLLRSRRVANTYLRDHPQPP